MYSRHPHPIDSSDNKDVLTDFLAVPLNELADDCNRNILNDKNWIVENK